MSSSDRSRTSDDPRYHYKAVVAQQGRVIVDRDFNAQETIVNARADADVLAIVGPAGTPDDGFAISVPVSSPPVNAANGASAPSFDFAIGAGVGVGRWLRLGVKSRMTQTGKWDWSRRASRPAEPRIRSGPTVPGRARAGWRCACPAWRPRRRALARRPR